MTSGSIACRDCPSAFPQTFVIETSSTPAAPLFAFTHRYASHTARLEILNGFVLSNSSSHCLVDSQIRLNNSTPSLHPHYRDFFTTTGCPAPVLRIGTLILGGSAPWISPFPSERQVPTVPHKSPNQTRATYMPDTIHPVNRFPMDSSQDKYTTLVLMSSQCFRHVIDGLLLFAFLIHT